MFPKSAFRQIILSLCEVYGIGNFKKYKYTDRDKINVKLYLVTNII